MRDGEKTQSIKAAAPPPYTSDAYFTPHIKPHQQLHYSSISSISIKSAAYLSARPNNLPNPRHLAIMQLSRILATLFTLASVQGYVITIFDDKGCTGNNKRVNVWDNTCRDGDVLNTKSFRVEKYGGSRQVADIYPSNSCGTVRVASWVADGGSDMFKQDRCLDLPEPARAFGSRSG